jgi:hypothetical protein
VTAKQQVQLESYLDYLLETNKVMNLTGELHDFFSRQACGNVPFYLTFLDHIVGLLWCSRLASPSPRFFACVLLKLSVTQAKKPPLLYMLPPFICCTSKYQSSNFVFRLFCFSTVLFNGIIGV